MIFNFKKDNLEIKESNLVKTAALLIYAAKIDENYSENEKEIIKKALIKLGEKQENVDNTMLRAERIESESNQILDFTKEVKNFKSEDKEKIIEILWDIIYSDNKSDMYELNLMRRLSGLLYLDNKTVGDIKERVKIKNSK